ncbi:VOC family protein [Rheinheimera texasensis]|uniref:VOC family protein n=1 Tax=Rheinheimera texasensis TaxID=306205 RepID=UPI0032B17939
MLGLRTVIYPVADLAAATAWYQQVFQTGPYFNQPFYVGFAIGGFELGLVPDGQPSRDGQVVYWGTEDIDAELERIRALGAVVVAAVTDVGEGIRVASLGDPFGNVLGLIQNPLFNLAQVR